MGEEQREMERETQADSVLSSELNAGLHLTTLRSRLELKPRVGHPIDCTTQVPHPLLDCKMKR